MDVGGGSFSFLQMWALLGFPCSSGQPHTHEPMGNTIGWIEGAVKKKLNLGRGHVEGM